MEDSLAECSKLSDWRGIQAREGVSNGARCRHRPRTGMLDRQRLNSIRQIGEAYAQEKILYLRYCLWLQINRPATTVPTHS